MLGGALESAGVRCCGRSTGARLAPFGV